MFSSRLPPAIAPNAISRTVAELRAAGTALIDLTETNPTAVGFTLGADGLAALADPDGARYTPEPLGLASARAAVAEEYARSGRRLDPSRIVLTASTSEAYSVLFKLLCDPGDEVLVPQPSYPLFDVLTELDGVRPRPYRLDEHADWAIDRASVEAALTPRSRAVLVVSPNNPTGSMLRRDDREWLAALADARGLAVIADEVFADYLLRPRPNAVSCVGDTPALTFVLGGLSKSAGLPQMKLGWMTVGGPPPLVTAALARLEIICDAYLSVSTPVQVAAARLIAAGRDTQRAIAARASGNLARLREAVRAYPSVSLLEPEGGWSAVLRVPATMTEEALVLVLLREAHVLVHPGYFFDFPREAFLVVSLLPESVTFDRAIERILPLAAAGRGIEERP